MKKSTKRILFLVGASVGAIYAYNKFIENTATKKNLLSNEEGEYYPWKDEEIYYTKTGIGSPLLLIHDTDASASSAEWTKMLRRLEKNHTVYCIDLLGCGRSSKPSMEYTNFLYTQLLTDFINDVIGTKTTVLASNMSASLIVMTQHMNQNLFDHLILINPVSTRKLGETPDKLLKFKKQLMELPFIGTFVYNLCTNDKMIKLSFANKYSVKPQLITTKITDTYYEAAHTNGSNGRFLHASLLGNYMNNPIHHALKQLSVPTLIIGSKEMKGNEQILNDYHKINPNLDIIRITNGSLYPQLEVPEKITSIIEDYLM